MEHCMNCGEKLRGRADKKFCDDHCRVDHHNAKNKDRNNMLNEINSVLRKNAAILERLQASGIERLTKPMLLAADFDFNFFTHQYIGEEGDLYRYCYDLGYRIMDGDEIKIRKDE